jgi:predicted CoA-binding protein/GNAT superfamily N-acetyltransferase
MSPYVAEQEAHRICREPGRDHAALLALLDGEVVGCGSYDCIGAEARSAEVAFTVADDLHHHDIGMLLLEHLVSLARGRGISAFTAETLSENAAMLRVFADAGLQAQRSLIDGVYNIKFPLPADEADAALGTYRDTVAVRERAADVASMRPVLTPASVAVVGASRRPGAVERVILQNVITGDFAGPVYPVNPYAAELDGIRCLPSAAALPDHVDLAVIAVPANAVLDTARACGQRGVKALVVIAAGLSGPARAELLGICRRHGMRMVGPAGFGVASPGSGLNATFAARHPQAGMTMPVLTVDVGRPATGKRLAGARATRAATPLVTRRGTVRAKRHHRRH